MEDNFTIACSTGIDEAKEAFFYDSSYDPPLAVTAELAREAGLTAVQLERYEMFASGLSYTEMAYSLGVSAPALRLSTEKARGKVRNVLRARGLVEDRVPVPMHRRSTEVNELMVRAMRIHGIGR